MRQCAGTFSDHSGRPSSLHHGSVLDRGDQLFVWDVAVLLGRQLSVQSPGPSAGPSRGPGGVVLGSGPGLGQTPTCCTAAAVGQREGPDAAVQGVGGGSRTW